MFVADGELTSYTSAAGEHTGLERGFSVCAFLSSGCSGCSVRKDGFL